MVSFYWGLSSNKIKQNDFDYNLDYESYIKVRDEDRLYSKRFDVLENFDSGLSIRGDL